MKTLCITADVSFAVPPCNSVFLYVFVLETEPPAGFQTHSAREWHHVSKQQSLSGLEEVPGIQLAMLQAFQVRRWQENKGLKGMVGMVRKLAD